MLSSEMAKFQIQDRVREAESFRMTRATRSVREAERRSRSRRVARGALAERRLDVRIHDIREAATDRHRSTDDEPYGGGPGMVMKPEPVFAAVEALGPDRGRTILLSPSGRRLDRDLVHELASEPGLVL